MNGQAPRALIAEDEPLLRASLVRLLGEVWPELDIVASARSGRESLERFEALHPDLCFLDVHMPGLSGLEVARRIGTRAHVVFVTAFDRYAVEAFEQGAVDYLVKPVETPRLALTVARLKARLDSSQPVRDVGPLLDLLLERLKEGSPRHEPPEPLRWLRVSSGRVIRVVPVDAVDYLRSEDKYTQVAWRDEAGTPCEGLVRTPLKDLIAQFDPAQFTQVHRSVVVNLRAISHLVRDTKETGVIHLKSRRETLPVSRSFLRQFHHM